MASRMDKYKDNRQEEIPTRSDKNKTLYKQIYNAYDEFENLVIPSNAREITPDDLKKEITDKKEYLNDKDEDINIKFDNKIVEDDEVYDINLLINKAVNDNKDKNTSENNIPNDEYLKKLKLDNRKTNLEQVKEVYEDIKEDTLKEDESLMQTANLSLEILSDLKSDSDVTLVSAPIKDDELPTREMDFYSNNYRFSKSDFEDKGENIEKVPANKKKEGKLFLKILLIVFIIVLFIVGIILCIKYFNRV